MILGLIYRHPQYDILDFTEKMTNSLQSINDSNLSYVIMGDFNIDLTKSMNPAVKNYEESLLSLGCKQFITSPTRYSLCGAKCSLLDHIYSNYNDDTLSNKIILNDISDHFPIVTEVNTQRNEYSDEVIYKRDMSKFSPDNFLNDLQLQMDTLPNQIAPNLDGYVQRFSDIYATTVEKHAPLQKLKKKEMIPNQKPWLTKTLLQLVKKKNRMFKKFIRKKTTNSRKAYVLLRNKVTHAIEQSKRSYYNNLFLSSQHNSRALWKNIRKVVKSKESKSINMVIDHHNNKISTPDDLSNTFNDFFY